MTSTGRPFGYLSDGRAHDGFARGQRCSFKGARFWRYGFRRAVDRVTNGPADRVKAAAEDAAVGQR